MIIFLKKNKIFKYLRFKKKTRLSGRSFGKILNWHRGGGYQILYRSIDFYRFLWNIYGLVLTIEYNPLHFKLISLVFYFNGIFSYIFHIKGIKVGSIILSSHKTKIKIGNAMYLKYIPYGTFVHNLELYSKCGAQYIRSCGSYGKVLNKFKNFVKVKLKSGIKKFFFINNFAVIGIINDFMHLYKLYSINAGFNRSIGWRPTTRGVAMNAVDHPNGGGKGKKSCKSVSFSPWGKLPKGKKVKK